MLAERVLDLVPGARLDGRTGERAAARLIVGLLLAPACGLAAALVLALALTHAAGVAIWRAGLATGAALRPRGPLTGAGPSRR